MQDELAAMFGRTLAMTAWSSVDNVLLYVACSLYGRQALKLLREEENEHVAEQIEEAISLNKKKGKVSETGGASGGDEKEDGIVKKEEREKKCLRMAVLSWRLRHEMVQKMRTRDEWEGILNSVGIGFEKVDHEGKGGSDGEGRGMEERSERKKKRRKRNKEEEEVLLEYRPGMSMGEREEGGLGWRLSIDGYKLVWDTVRVGSGFDWI